MSAWRQIKDEAIKNDHHLLTTIVDGMARKGMLNEARQFIADSNSKCTALLVVLLSGCRKFNNLEIGQSVFEELRKRADLSQNDKASAALMMSHIFAANGHFEKMKKIRKWLNKMGPNKDRIEGVSEIEIFGVFHTFKAGNAYLANPEYAECVDRKLR